jgi:hypothetical protein
LGMIMSARGGVADPSRRLETTCSMSIIWRARAREEACGDKKYSRGGQASRRLALLETILVVAAFLFLAARFTRRRDLPTLNGQAAPFGVHGDESDRHVFFFLRARLCRALLWYIGVRFAGYPAAKNRDRQMFGRAIAFALVNHTTKRTASLLLRSRRRRGARNSFCPSRDCGWWGRDGEGRLGSRAPCSTGRRGGLLLREFERQTRAVATIVGLQVERTRTG